MGAKSEALARQFEAKSREALPTLERLGEADWTKVTEAEKWSVETIARHRKGSATAAATVRGLSGAELATSGTVLKDTPPMSAEQLIAGALLGHIDRHYGSIRETVGH